MKILNKTTKIFKFKTILLCAALILCCVNDFGQSITWQRTILAPDIEYFTSVVQTPDDGYIAVGRKRESGVRDDMYIVRYNKFGDTLWSKTVDVELAECIIKTLDNNYLICGHEGSLVKINQNGDILQIRPFLGYDFLILNTVLQINTGDYFISGRYRSSIDIPYLAKYDSNLNLIFDSLYTSNRFSGGFSNMIFSDDYNLILVGNHFLVNGGPLNLFLAKINQNGNILWENTFTDYQNLISRTIAKTNGNNYIIGGYSFLAKFNSNGFNLWYQNIDSSYYNEIWDIKSTYDNNFIMAGWFYDGISAFARIRKIDTNGVTIWVKSHGFENQNNEGWEINQTTDTGFVIVGRTDIQEEDPYILKIDKNGSLNPIGINSISSQIPKNYQLYQNFPNPFNPKTTIKFDIPVNSYTILTIFDILGRRIKTLIDNNLKPSEYTIDLTSEEFSSGIYFYTLTATNNKNINYKSTRKFIIIK